LRYHAGAFNKLPGAVSRTTDGNRGRGQAGLFTIQEDLMKRLLLLVVFALVPCVGPSAQVTSPAAPPSGFAPDRLARVDRVFQQFVDEDRLGGAVALVLRDGKPVYEKAFGWSDKEAGRRMTTDSIFRIASQTKALTSVAILSLLEEGRLALGDAAGKYIPGFAKTTVAVPDDSRVKLVPARRPITIRDLLTHTAGISYGNDRLVAAEYEAKGLGPAAGYGWYTADKDEPICTTMERLATLPFVAQPGEAWVYGYNTDILGCIVERVAGVPLDEFIRTRITGPLGMKDTQFYLPPAQRERLAVVYSSSPDGRITRAPEGAKGQGHYLDGPRKSFSGGAGLLSTARDYARFLEMIRNRGSLDGVRVLSSRSVDLMSTNQVGTLHSANGLGFGLGFEVTERYGASGMDSVGAFGWGGAYGSTYRVDPKTRMVLVMMIQLLPNMTGIAERFNALAYQSLVDEPMQ
jgi:CubicO group peptidase (beta-lactamase class C family)